MKKDNLSEREKMIIDFYEDGDIPIHIKVDTILYKISTILRRKINELRSIRIMDRKRPSTISNNGNSNTRTN